MIFALKNVLMFQMFQKKNVFVKKKDVYSYECILL